MASLKCVRVDSKSECSHVPIARRTGSLAQTPWSKTSMDRLEQWQAECGGGSCRTSEGKSEVSGRLAVQTANLRRSSDGSRAGDEPASAAIPRAPAARGSPGGGWRMELSCWSEPWCFPYDYVLATR